MASYMPIFEDGETPVEEILKQVGTSGWSANSSEVGVIAAAHAIDGEMWAPQITPFKEWKPRGDGWRASTSHDGDLYVVGALNMGMSNELRESLIAQALDDAKKEEEEKRALAALESDVEEPFIDPDVIDLPLVFGVKQNEEGCVLTKVDLHQYAKRSHRERDLILALPSHVDGVPIVRIDADTFSRFNVRGIGVRLVIVPDTVRVIDANVFRFLSAEYIYLGAGVEDIGGQPFERWALNPPLDRRSYLVSEQNTHWQSVRGSLVSKDGKTLMFFAPPYGQRVRIPEAVEVVAPDAFANLGTIPEVVECGHGLNRVSSKLWDSALWLCPQDAPMFSVLLKRGVRMAGPDVVVQDDCWFDFDECGALLVAGPPAPPSVSQLFAHAAAGVAKGEDSVSPAAIAKQAARSKPEASSLRLPKDVAGRKLYRIAARALNTSPTTLIIPEGVESVGADNSCKGCQNLSLPQSLRRIEAHSFTSRCLAGVTSIPAGVLSIGAGSFEYSVVRLEHTGTIVHISANQLLNCFIERSDEEIAALEGASVAERVPFDFKRYDEILCQDQTLPDLLGALVHRIAVPFALEESSRKNIVGQLRARGRDAMEYVAREGDCETVAKLLEAGFIDDDTFDEQIELLRRCNRMDSVMLLMERKRERDAAKNKQASIKSRFSL